MAFEIFAKADLAFNETFVSAISQSGEKVRRPKQWSSLGKIQRHRHRCFGGQLGPYYCEDLGERSFSVGRTRRDAEKCDRFVVELSARNNPVQIRNAGRFRNGEAGMRRLQL